MQRGVFIGGDDFKSGQTKIKSVLVDFLVSAGIKVRINETEPLVWILQRELASVILQVYIIKV